MHNRRAFTLIELSVVLIFAGLIAAFALKMFESTGRAECYTATKEQLEQIREAIERFAVNNDRFPMPARRYVGVDNKLYGKEITLAEIADVDKVDNITAGNVTSTALFGAIPFSTIGIALDKAADCWGNKLTYVVTQDLADPTKDPVTQETKFLSNATEGAITIKTNNSLTFLGEAGYAIISHGEDQLGAVKANFDDMSATTPSQRGWCAATANPPAIREQNCDMSPVAANNNTDLIAAPFNNGKDADADHYFDDVIVYRGKPWRVGACPGCCPMCALMPMIIDTMD